MIHWNLIPMTKKLLNLILLARFLDRNKLLGRWIREHSYDAGVIPLSYRSEKLFYFELPAIIWTKGTCWMFQLHLQQGNFTYLYLEGYTTLCPKKWSDSLHRNAQIRPVTQGNKEKKPSMKIVYRKAKANLS